MTKEHEITPAMLREWEACWLDEEIASHYAGREALTLEEIILDDKICIEHVAWVGVKLVRSVGAPIFPLVDSAVREAVPMALASRGWHDLADRLRAIAPIVGRQTARAAHLVTREVRDKARNRAAASYDACIHACMAAVAADDAAYAYDVADDAAYAYEVADGVVSGVAVDRAPIRAALLGAILRCLAGAP